MGSYLLSLLMSRPRVFDIGRPLIMAHRGDPGAGPENSIPAMRGAVEVGVDVLETDLRLTRDGHVVLFHDEGLARMTGHRGSVEECTLDELFALELRAGAGPNSAASTYDTPSVHIPTLEEAFREFAGARFNLDMKSKDSRLPAALAALIEQYDRSESVIVGSFHERQVTRFRRLAPDVHTAAHPGEVTRFLFALKMHAERLFARRPCCAAFQVPVKYGLIRVVDRRFVTAAHERGIAVHVWPVIDRPTMEHLVDLGVDGVFTDRPSLLRDVLVARGLI